MAVKKELLEEFLATMVRIRKAIMEFQDDNNNREKVVTGLQFHGLVTIAENPHITIGEFANRCRMTSGAIAQFVSRLENAKLIEKSVDAADKRIFHLALTQIGKEQLHTMKKRFACRIEAMLNVLSENDLKELIRIQKLFLDNFEKQKHGENI